MYPYIFGVIDSYVLFLFIGVICAFLLLSLYFKFVHKKDKYLLKMIAAELAYEG